MELNFLQSDVFWFGFNSAVGVCLPFIGALIPLVTPGPEGKPIDRSYNYYISPTDIHGHII